MPGENTDTTFVVDASFILSFLLPDEDSTQADKVFEQYRVGGIQLVSSAILPFEVVNGVRYAVASRRIEKNIASQLVKDFLKLDILLVNIGLGDVFMFALEKDISVYDASYIYLARQKGTRLLTLDKRLKRLAE